MSTYQTSAHCPECERAGRPSLQKASPAERIAEGYTAKRWQIAEHSDGAGSRYPGSGAKV